MSHLPHSAALAAQATMNAAIVWAVLAPALALGTVAALLRPPPPPPSGRG